MRSVAYVIPIWFILMFVYGNIRWYNFSKLYEKRSGRFIWNGYILYFKRIEGEYFDKYRDDKELMTAFRREKKVYWGMRLFTLLLMLIAGYCSYLSRR